MNRLLEETEVAERLALFNSIDPENLIKTPEAVQQAMVAEQQQQLVASATPSIVKAAEGPIGLVADQMAQGAGIGAA